jgi:16S rRNA (cytidine1402-2'-O)-methyltransferase
MLFIVSTPIGNLGDITFRAVETLKSADLIAAEDTRRTAVLLQHYSIHAKMLSYNDHNKSSRIPGLINLLNNNKNIALVSDSGTPGISDPGFALIREAIKNNIAVVPVPGPNAAISALVASGLPTDSFAFYGFLPKKEKAKRDFFEKIKAMNETVIVHESPYRIQDTILLMKQCIPEKNVCIARELTKKFEEFIRGTPEELHGKIAGKQLKGEIVLVIGKADKEGKKDKE